MKAEYCKEYVALNRALLARTLVATLIVVAVNQAIKFTLECAHARARARAHARPRPRPRPRPPTPAPAPAPTPAPLPRIMLGYDVIFAADSSIAIRWIFDG